MYKVVAVVVSFLDGQYEVIFPATLFNCAGNAVELGTPEYRDYYLQFQLMTTNSELYEAVKLYLNQ